MGYADFADSAPKLVVVVTSLERLETTVRLIICTDRSTNPENLVEGEEILMNFVSGVYEA